MRVTALTLYSNYKIYKYHTNNIHKSYLTLRKTY